MKRNQVLTILKEFKYKNQSKYGISELGLFGSFARDEATEQSDVDICIKTEAPDMFAIVHIKDELQKLLLSTIDIVRVRDKMNPFLKNRIDKEAIYV